MPESVVRQFKIMISSTRTDLSQYREEASKVIAKVRAEKEKRLQLVEVSMEKETQSGDREFAVAVSKRWVEEVDWVVVIVGWNYGTISDEVGADGLSVTEWEYRHAFKLGKKLFVFIAGSPGTANSYRVSEGDEEDLKDWIGKQSTEQKEKLENFKRELGKPHAEMFRNRQGFRERLEKTLKDAIEDLTPEVQPGTPLAELIVALQPNIRGCIRKVALITACKRIHDHLHELRQHVIRPLREEVLPVWKQDGTLSVPRERVIWRCMTAVAKSVGGIREVGPLIGPDHQGLRDSVDGVMQRPPLWNIESDSRESSSSRESFTEVVDDFAIDVQRAFSQADRSMEGEERHLHERYHVLLEELKHARERRKLGPSDQQRLDDELEKIDANRSRVRNSLIIHHRWQESHDKLEEVESICEAGGFDRKLNHYRRVDLAMLLSLVEEELTQAAAQQTGGAEIEQVAVAVAVQQTQAPVLSFRHTSNGFVNDLRQLKASLEALRQGAGVDAFDKMRKPFDDAFYYVDKRTLNEVERAQEQVVKLEDWLDGLAAAERKRA